ncbi:hypothetical protein AB0I34_21120 [Kribbella sp. NPDC050281]|uniref:hypothetical protein n=1 Tax=Kribbella sp. NPDC050281 TaxID=3155515 RepID=UPI0033E8936D
MNDLSHVFWLGGGSGGGKSTVARHLVERFGVRLYDTDRAMADHTARSALGNLLERDRRFTDQVAMETRRLGLTSIVVDGSRTEDELAVRVAGLFGLGHPA